jgi:hypothetical protein
MTVYVEYAVLDNLVINCVLLGFVLYTVRRKLVLWKILTCIGIGAVFAVGLPILSMGLLSFFSPGTFTIAIAILMCVKVLVTVIFLAVMLGLIRFLNKRGKLTGFLHDVVITMGEQKYRVRGYMDTGNRLTDGDAPVVVISMSLFLKMFPEIAPDRIVLNKLDADISSGHYINFSTVGRNGKMFVFSPSGLEIVDKDRTTAHGNVRLGVSMRSFCDAVKYDALLNANLAV